VSTPDRDDHRIGSIEASKGPPRGRPVPKHPGLDLPAVVFGSNPDVADAAAGDFAAHRSRLSSRIVSAREAPELDRVAGFGQAGAGGVGRVAGEPGGPIETTSGGGAAAHRLVILGGEEQRPSGFLRPEPVGRPRKARRGFQSSTFPAFEHALLDERPSGDHVVARSRSDLEVATGVRGGTDPRGGDAGDQRGVAAKGGIRGTHDPAGFRQSGLVSAVAEGEHGVVVAALLPFAASGQAQGGEDEGPDHENGRARGAHGTVWYEVMKLHDRIRGMLLRRPFREVAVDDQRRWRGATMLYVAAHLAKAIESTTDRPRIGVMLPTSGLFPAALLAAWRLGRTVVPLNYLLSPEDLAFVIEDAGLDAVVTVGPMLNFTGQLPDGVTAIKMEQLKVKGLPPRTKRRPMADDEPAVILYTSGTSGRPKGVILTSGNLSSNIDQIVEWVKFDRTDVMLGVLPQFHSFGLTVLTLLPLAVGCRSVYAARFMPKRVLQLAREHRPTVLVGIPSMFNALRLAKSATRDDLSSLRFTVAGGEPLPDAVSDGFFETFGIRICEGYGLTETAPCTNWCRPDEYRAHKVGMAMPGIEERIVGENGEILGPEQDGEVRIKGPNVMPGYFNRPEETAAAFDEDGFFRTGDMGRMDADGFLSITGRIKEMLIIGGENVFPREIEEVLDAHPSVRASAVIGAPDESRGEVALAFVELVDDATFDVTSLRSHCRDRLPQFKVPREIRRLEELPRNPTGKIMRRALGPDTSGVD